MATTTSRTFRFTEKAIQALPVPDDGRAKAQWSDAGCTGLKHVVTAGGKRRWEFRYTHGGRKCVMPLGPYPAVGLPDARKKALAAQAELAEGRDPMDESRQRRADLTVAEFCEEHFVPHQKASKRSWETDVFMLNRRILPVLGKKKLRDVTRHDAVQLLNSVAAVRSQTTANRHFTCLARLLSLAHQWDFVPANVARGVKKFREQQRKERFLSPEEIRKLDAALRAQKNAVSAGAVRLLLWTGMRRGEATGLLWEDVTLEGEAPSLYLRMTKSGRPRTVPLNTAALQVLREMLELRAEGNPHVFPWDNDLGHVWDLKWVWERTKKACGLEDSLRLHDLRHSFASSLVQNGTSLYVVQKLLGHESPTMTQRYSHLGDGVLRLASETVADQATDEE